MRPCHEHVPRSLLLVVATLKTKAKAATIPVPTMMSVIELAPYGNPQVTLIESNRVSSSQNGALTTSKEATHLR
jgi:hypothetical protein